MTAIITGGVVEEDRKFLLVQEAQEKCYGKWSIPAGHLDPNETIFEAARREIMEETGCVVELTGIVQIANRVIKDSAWMSVIFATKLLSGNIHFDTTEILDAKWFTYEEILEMLDELRNPEWIMAAIDNKRNDRVADMNLIKILSD